MRVVIPLAGLDKRFSDLGFPKPLAPVEDTTLIQHCLSKHKWLLEHELHFIVHVADEKYSLSEKLAKSFPQSHIHVISEKTEGAACTVLLLKDIINDTQELIVYLADIDFRGELQEFITHNEQFDGIIPTFTSTKKKYSYAKTKNNLIIEVAEKKVISSDASAGFYYFRKGECFVRGAESMINKNLRVNNAFFICPVYNELIEMGLTCTIFPVQFKKDLGDALFIRELEQTNP